MPKTVLLICVCLLPQLTELHGKKELPSFVKICKRNDPNLAECVKSSIYALKPHLGKGIPEMKIPSFNPLRVSKLTISSGDLEFKFDNLEFALVDHFDIEKVEFDLEKCEAALNVFHPLMPVKGMYDADGRLLAFQLHGAGTFDSNFTSVHISAAMKCRRETRNGKEYAKFSVIKFKIKIGDMHIQLNDLFSENPELTERTNDILNENAQSLLGDFESLAGAAVEHIVLNTVHGVFNTFPLNVLLPQ